MQSLHDNEKSTEISKEESHDSIYDCPKSSPPNKSAWKWNLKLLKHRLTDSILFLFEKFGYLVYDHPWKFIIIPVLLCLITSYGFRHRSAIYDMDVLYSLPVSTTKIAENELVQVFPIRRSTFIFLVSKTGEGLLTKRSMDDIDQLWDRLLQLKVPTTMLHDATNPTNVTIRKYFLSPPVSETFEYQPDYVPKRFNRKDLVQGGSSDFIQFEDVCEHTAFGTCDVMNPLDLYLFPNQRGKPVHVANYPDFINVRSKTIYRLDSILGGIELSEDPSSNATIVHNVTSMAFRLLLLGGADYDLQSAAWEQAALTFLQAFQLPTMDIYVRCDRSVNDELARSSTLTGNDLFMLTIACLAVSLFTVLMHSSVDWYRTKTLPTLFGVSTTLIAYGGSAGFLYWMGVNHVPPAEATPFMMLGICVDDVFVITNAYTLTYMYIDQPRKRIGISIRDSGMSISITTSTNIIAFLAGAVSPYYSIRVFCMLTAFGLFVGYLMCLTAFLGALSLAAKHEQKRRDQQGRHVFIPQTPHLLSLDCLNSEPDEPPHPKSPHNLHTKDDIEYSGNAQLLSSNANLDNESHLWTNSFFVDGHHMENSPAASCQFYSRHSPFKSYQSKSLLPMEHSSQDLRCLKDNQEPSFEGPSQDQSSPQFARISSLHSEKNRPKFVHLSHVLEEQVSSAHKTPPAVFNATFQNGLQRLKELRASQNQSFEVSKLLSSLDSQQRIHREARIFFSQPQVCQSLTQYPESSPRDVPGPPARSLEIESRRIGAPLSPHCKNEQCCPSLLNVPSRKQCSSDVDCLLHADNFMNSGPPPQSKHPENSLQLVDDYLKDGYYRLTKLDNYGLVSYLCQLPQTTSCFNTRYGGKSIWSRFRSKRCATMLSSTSLSSSRSLHDSNHLQPSSRPQPGWSHPQHAKSAWKEHSIALYSPKTCSKEDQLDSLCHIVRGYNYRDLPTVYEMQHGNNSRSTRPSPSDAKSNENHSVQYVYYPYGLPPEPIGNVGRVPRKLFMYYGPWLMKPFTKLAVVVLFCVLTVASLYFVFKLKSGLQLKDVTPYESYLRDFLNVQAEHFSVYGDECFLFFTQPSSHHRSSTSWKSYFFKRSQSAGSPLAPSDSSPSKLSNVYAWWDPEIQLQVEALDAFLNDLPHVVYVMNGFKYFLSYSRAHQMDISTPESFINGLTEWSQTLEGKVFASDFIIANNRLRGWRIHYWMRYNDNTRTAIGWIENVREYLRTAAEQTNFPQGYVYSPLAIHWESDLIIFQTTLATMAGALVAMSFVAFLLLRSWIAGLLIMLDIIFIDIGVMGTMPLIGLQSNMLTMVNLVLSIGFAVDYTTHITHCFTHCRGPTKNQRALESLCCIGFPITEGMVTTYLAVGALAISNKYIMVVVFRMMTCVLLFASLHGIVFIPVFLSLIGPFELDPVPILDVQNGQVATVRYLDGHSGKMLGIVDCPSTSSLQFKHDPAMLTNLLTHQSPLYVALPKSEISNS